MSALRSTVVAGAAVAALCAASAHAQSGDYAAQVGQARAERVAKLKQADGYLTLIASGWLEPGDNTVGAAADNRFQVPGAPEHLGVLHLDASGAVDLRTAAGVTVTVDGHAVTSASMQTQGAHGEHKPTRAYLGAERYLYVIESGRQRGLRVKDNAAPLRKDFPGIPYFPVDPSWKIEAQWQPFATPHTLRIANVVGTESDEAVPGQAVFERNGQRYTLTPMEEDGRLFFVFSDRTAGKLTYGGARFLYAGMPKDGKVTLDFNLAENPPCAITPHVVCPLAPPENRLRLEVTAGEQKFHGAGH